ncbi:2-hydroxymuconate tautomerase family protein [Martelella lutilitoris]|uniref:Tautomerase n=1 Tax=Martelella lutilitoris TaxID=2583532 RepID=A0A7T7HGR9_9HYPH|nr:MULTISPECIES: 2-hydroxymuconate tautomerase [Martelella]AMM84354.1 4-oxalocrotonate tautomerase [Martelella sp. AD-3]MAM13360.1 4-oxalocrotonate tautomerase [Rhizobiaceae bacterium]QQM28898.1 2-hydroxymuconate tautomerase family protein [Martelella lutilitoris]
MPFVDVTMIEGRSNAVKEKLIEKLTEAVVETTGVPIESVRVVLREVPGHHWGIAGKPKFPAPDAGS